MPAGVTTSALQCLPSARYSLRLVVKSNGQDIALADWDALFRRLEESHTTLRVRLVGRPGGEIIAQYEGALAGGWDPAAWGQERFFQVDDLRDIQMAGAADLELELKSSRAEVLPKGISVQPVLVAGGFRV